MSRIEKILLACGLGLIVVAVMLVVFWLQPPALQQPKPFRIQTVGAQNLGFEGTYVNWEGSEERKIAPSWMLWYKTDWPDEKNTLAPPRANGVTSPRLEGDRAQHVYWQGGKNFDACVYQQVSDLTVGHYVRFTIWGKVDTQMGLHDMQTRVGIDPDGGTNPLDIQYELHPDNWDVYTVGNGQWQQMSVAIKATSETATLYACAHPRWPMSFDVYWDQAQFSMVPEKLVYLPLVSRRHFTPPPPGTLWNPDLELGWGEKEGYQLPLEGYTNVYVAPYWMPFWNDDFNPDTGQNRQPEYNYADRDYRVHHGLVAQQYGLSAWGGFEAGIYQVVSGTVPGETVRFTIWGLGWSSDTGGDDRYSDVREGLNYRVGIDPYGGESYTSTQIIWSDFYDPYDEWHPFEITATVESDQISVWAYTFPTAYWIRFNQVFWDDASLTVIDLPPEGGE
jgi:hypothetical protein